MTTNKAKVVVLLTLTAEADAAAEVLVRTADVIAQGYVGDGVVLDSTGVVCGTIRIEEETPAIRPEDLN